MAFFVLHKTASKATASCAGGGFSISVQAYAVGADAPWRQADNRMSHWDLIAYLLTNGAWNPIWKTPWIHSRIFRVDWLHCADQGVAADYIGNVLWLLQTKVAGGSVKVRVNALWQEICDEYALRHVQDRLQNLVPTMIKAHKKAPKLRCSAAQCRALVPIVRGLAEKHFDEGQPVEQAAMVGMGKLDQCYRALSKESIFSADILRTCSTEFALQYVALDRAHPGIYNIYIVYFYFAAIASFALASSCSGGASC